MGRHAARNILRAIAALPAEPFRYRDKGSFATIGRGKAVGELAGGLKLSGFLAWVAWLAIHIFFLIGFRNRVLVLLQWAWAYVTWQRGARLITGVVQARLRRLNLQHQALRNEGHPRGGTVGILHDAP